MLDSPSIIVRLLRIKGAERDYEVPFAEGINVIWGDMDSGKSSILSLIAYALGASSFDTYEEILRKGREVFLYVELSGKPYVFQRSLLNNQQHILCHPGEVGPLVRPKVLSANIEDDAPDGYISFFVLDLLGLPRTKVKKSPSKIDSTMDRVGFKDVLKFLYLKQKDISADTLLNMSDGARYTKNKQILRYLLNIYNENVAEIEAELAAHVKEHRAHIAERDNIFEFLKRVGIDLELDYEAQLGAQISLTGEIDAQIALIKEKHAQAVLLDDEVSRDLERGAAWRAELKERTSKKENELVGYRRLQATYEKEISSINTSRTLRKTFGGLYDEEHGAKCPVCASLVVGSSEQGGIVSDSVLEREGEMLRHRLRGLKDFILKTEEDLSDLVQTWEESEQALRALTASYDSKYAKEVSATVEVIQHLEREKSEILEVRKVLERDARVVNNFGYLSERISALQVAIDRIGFTLKSAREKQIDPATVVSRLDGIFSHLMRNSGLQNMTGIGVDQRLDYHIRGKSYIALTSGGLRTISSINIYLSKLIYALEYPSYFPTFMMIDTPGQNIGRNRDISEHSEVADPAIYENVYKRLAQIAESAAKKQVKCQIILVDNDLPPFAIANKSFYISKRFSKSEPGFDKGLIADA